VISGVLPAGVIEKIGGEGTGLLSGVPRVPGRKKEKLLSDSLPFQMWLYRVQCLLLTPPKSEGGGYPYISLGLPHEPFSSSRKHRPLLYRRGAWGRNHFPRYPRTSSYRASPWSYEEGISGKRAAFSSKVREKKESIARGGEKPKVSRKEGEKNSSALVGKKKGWVVSRWREKKA